MSRRKTARALSACCSTSCARRCRSSSWRINPSGISSPIAPPRAGPTRPQSSSGPAPNSAPLQRQEEGALPRLMARSSRMAALIPPARKHLVRYYRALEPRSPLRWAVSQAARQKAGAAELEAGYSVTVLGKVESGVGLLDASAMHRARDKHHGKVSINWRTASCVTTMSPVRNALKCAIRMKHRDVICATGQPIPDAGNSCKG